MDVSFREVLRSGAAALGLPLDAEAAQLLERYADRLLAWNRKVNLTAITDPAELAEKHLVDSLALLPLLGVAKTLLDVGSGAGLPGIPLACARRDLQVTCCDSVAKKIAFVKAVSAELRLPVRGVATRADGAPAREGLPLADVVVSRALAEPERWVPLGARYLDAGGLLVAMLGRGADEKALESLGAAQGLRLEGVTTLTLPRSGAARAFARWRAP